MNPADPHQNPSADRSKRSVECGGNQGIPYQSLPTLQMTILPKMPTLNLLSYMDTLHNDLFYYTKPYT